MAGFGRSNSLSINTGGGGGGLFGNNASQNQPQTTNTQPQSSGGLFASSQQQQPQSGSLFGAQPAATQPQSGSLFGNTLSKQATPGAGAGAGGLFGNTAAPAQNQSTTQAGGLFGGTGQSKPSLFASSTQQAQPASVPSLFGSTHPSQPQQQQQQQNSLFGGMNSQARPVAGASQLGAGAQPVQMTLDSIRGTTRFNDLHPDLQTLIQQFDQGIQQKINYCNQIRETLPSSETDIATIAPDVTYIENLLSTAETGLDNDSTNIAHLKQLVKNDAADATLSFRAIENQRLPAQFHYRNGANLTASSAKAPASTNLDEDDPTKPVDLMSYFNRRTEDLGCTLDGYQLQIREIEAHLRTMEAGTVEKAQQLTGSRSAPRDQRRELVEALKAIEGAILDSAKKVGQVRDEVTKQTLGNVGAALL